MKSYLVVALFICASYAVILAHNDDGNLKDRDDNDGAVIEGQVLDLEERVAECNKVKKCKEMKTLKEKRKCRRMKRQEKKTKKTIENEANRTPFTIKAKGEFEGMKVCCHRDCPKCGGNNCAYAENKSGEIMDDQGKKCCGKKIAETAEICEDQEDGTNEGPCILFN